MKKNFELEHLGETYDFTYETHTGAGGFGINRLVYRYDTEKGYIELSDIFIVDDELSMSDEDLNFDAETYLESELAA